MIDLVRQEVVQAADTVVVKIGTRVLTHADGTLDLDHLAHLTEQLVGLLESGRKVVLVSSGAIGAGLGRLGKNRRPTALPELQAAAAIGQSYLIQVYDTFLQRHGYHAAQLLLTGDDFNHRGRYLNMRNTIRQCFQWKAVPIINENDTVSVEEIRFGDNDQLAAMVTNLLRAPLLVILSVVDGLYAETSADGPVGEPIDKVMSVDDSTLALAGTSTSNLGTGGMRSKLQAARLAAAAGESVWIVNGRTPNILKRVMNGERVGTLIPATGGSVNSWKRWIGYTAKPRGAYVVDEGAYKALKEDGRSLLSVGIIDVRGQFSPGDVVAIEHPSENAFARGLTNYSSQEARRIMGLSSKSVAEILPGSRYDSVVHRDNLVVL